MYSRVSNLRKRYYRVRNLIRSQMWVVVILHFKNKYRPYINYYKIFKYNMLVH